jgi:phosphoserine phosphatase
VKEAFTNAPKIANIKDVLKNISNQGHVSCLITASQDFFANHFYEYGFDYIYASEEYCLDQKKLKERRPIESKDKLRLARELCEKLALKFDDTVAFGDSISDVHLFKNLTHTVSVNGDHHIHDLAAHHYTGLDLQEAFQLVHHWSMKAY